MSKKVPKGNYGYIEYQKKASVIRTVIFFALSLAIYGIGIYSTGSNKNLLTVVAVLGLLPSCKSAVNAIMFLRASGCSGGAKEKISDYDDKLTGFYDMYFTSYQKNFPISHMVLKGNTICAYTESDKCDIKAGEAHLEQMLKQDGYKNMTIKIFDDLGKYVDRLSQLSSLDTQESKNREGMIQMFYSISL
ncbi:MAG: hypothetical protein NC314_08915 [Roseburia sp.]|nr:hypothetical protein [Ruminococcus sp.]MCM1155683.1 hypothetical protein [Roseburia sp.]MCM1242948.1 hypothetical protein [Roseburia sp.]